VSFPTYLSFNFPFNVPLLLLLRMEPFLYESGWKDGAAVFFYTLICIIMHAILQEYVLDVSLLLFPSNHH
jgi:hypothetical protein